VILIGSGSEVSVALEAHAALAAEGVAVRTVSMPSSDLFEEQPEEYREEVLPRAVEVRVAVEAGVSQGWDRYVGTRGATVGMTRFGASAPAEVLYKQFGLTGEAVAAKARELMKK
jgi:transketolase